MDMQGAVDIAKKHVSIAFQSEGAGEVQLEEVVFDEGSGHWLIGVSFLRKVRKPPNPMAITENHLSVLTHRTDFKVVKLRNEDGKIVSMTNGPMVTAAA